MLQYENTAADWRGGDQLAWAVFNQPPLVQPIAEPIIKWNKK